MILSCIGTWDVRWHWGCYKKSAGILRTPKRLSSKRIFIFVAFPCHFLHRFFWHFFRKELKVANTTIAALSGHTFQTVVAVEGTTASVPFHRHTAFLNFIQSLKTICVSTCFLHRQDLPSFSLADCTKNGFKLSNFRFILTSGYCAWNS